MSLCSERIKFSINDCMCFCRCSFIENPGCSKMTFISYLSFGQCLYPFLKLFFWKEYVIRNGLISCIDSDSTTGLMGVIYKVRDQFQLSSSVENFCLSISSILIWKESVPNRLKTRDFIASSPWVSRFS